MITDFNVFAYVINYLPNSWRLTTTIDFCMCLVKPLYELQTPIFDTFYNDSVRLAKATGQVLSLENNLQNQFGAGIYISNVENQPKGFFLAQGDDLKQSYSGARSDQINFVGVSYTNDVEKTIDFEINVPSVLNVAENDVRAFTDKFNLAGQKYNVIYY